MRYLLALIALFSVTVGGCTNFSYQDDFKLFSNASLTQIASSELHRFIGSSDRNVLVEFCVETDCARRESMTPSLVRLAEIYKESTEIVRVDFASNTELELLANYGGASCPTYALFEKGQFEPVFVQSFPVSSNILEAELLASLILADED